ncbi:cation diffusion facilitator family transporter [Pandoraea pneumonica]|jgi:cation diffusion facilitator family transporter|uniref:Cation diffusion facilitator family transporter n=1 Tax=Pandoraea pneumonica TaxID=2508299 RepID=A0A5E4WCG4_9BURK|nr:cation diffusion facilitator family transporter [Pandoraea pneumonica]VVE22757.1 cation diffusion facilitator family transporter [Pandoraea pneumonica]
MPYSNYDNLAASSEALDKHAVARHSTWVSIWVNVVLTTAQIVIGIFARSQALIADGIHSLSDIVSDFVVLAAARGSARAPDADHPYGHNRYENAASLFLGAILLVVGAGMLWRGIERLLHPEEIPEVHAIALGVAVLVLVCKEGLFRYMLRAAQRVRSAMLVANAWHARSDALSSLVVACGILGNLAGYRLLDPLAAALVGLMIGRTGWKFGWNALQDLIDRGVDDATMVTIRQHLLETPGVRAIDMLRTRRMGDEIVVDVHVLVDARLSVSEGHYIAEQARAAVMNVPQILDVLVHVDPESDTKGTALQQWPARAAVVSAAEVLCRANALALHDVKLHYINNGLEADVIVEGLNESATNALHADACGEYASQTIADALAARFGLRHVRVLRVTGETSATT